MLCSVAIIPMMQATKYRLTDERAGIASLDRTRNRRILLKPQVGSRLMVVGEVLFENPPQMPLVEHDDVVQTFLPNRTETLGSIAGSSILPLDLS